MSRQFAIIIGLLFFASATIGCQSAAAPTAAATPTVAANSSAAPDVVTADGVVEPLRSASLSFTVGGTVSAAEVKAGDQVQKGAVLAKLDDAAMQKQVAQAEADVALAQAQLDQLQAGGSPADRSAAQAALAAAQQNYDKVRAGPTEDQVAQLKAQMTYAKSQLDQAQAAYDHIGGVSNPDISMAPEAVQLQQASSNYSAAVAAYDDAIDHPTPAELAAAQAQVDQAQSALARLDPTTAALQVARDQVQSAQASLAVTKANDDAYTLTAPFDGVIGEKGVAVGDVITLASPTVAFTLGDVSKLHLETTNLAQVDLPRIKVGQHADVTLDAFPSKVFHGTVTQISPSASDNRGDKVFTVWIDLDEGTETGLRWGMSATARIAVH